MLILLDLPWFFQNWLPRSFAQLVSPAQKHSLLFAARPSSCSLQKLVQTSSHLVLCQHKKRTWKPRNDQTSAHSLTFFQEEKSINVNYKKSQDRPVQPRVKHTPEKDPLCSLGKGQAEQPERPGAFMARRHLHGTIPYCEEDWHTQGCRGKPRKEEVSFKIKWVGVKRSQK